VALQFHGVNYICFMFKGLSHRFNIDFEGRFILTTGAEKVKDDLHFFLIFNRVSRVYLPEYDPQLYWFLQKTSSQLEQFRILMLGNLRKKVLQFVPFIRINALDAWFDRGKKTHGVLVNFSFVQDPEVPLQTVVFI
jgi:hypothetical protein